MSSTTTVFGYHGTSAAAAESIIQEGFRPSTEQGHWLGPGVYFFEHAPDRARTWSETRYGVDETRVLQAEISLAGCLNLVNHADLDRLQGFYPIYERLYGLEGLDLKDGDSDGNSHKLDSAVVDFACAQIREIEGRPVTSVRSPFTDGSPLWKHPSGLTSIFCSLSHVQICVREPSAISQVAVHTALAPGAPKS